MNSRRRPQLDLDTLCRRKLAKDSDSAWWKGKFCPLMARAVDGKGRVNPEVQQALQFQGEAVCNTELVATYRTAREIVATQTGGIKSLAALWKLKNPPESFAADARERWKAYRAARAKARQHFQKIVWPLEITDRYTPAEARDLRKILGGNTSDQLSKLADKITQQDADLLDHSERMAEFLASDTFWKMPARDRESFLRLTHRRSPLFQQAFPYAMRYAAGLISRNELLPILQQMFPQFSLDEKIEFLRLCEKRTRPEDKKKNRLAVFYTWLQDNAPVFSFFRWHRQAVLNQAKESLGEKDLPEDPVFMSENVCRQKPRISLGLNEAPCKDESDADARPRAELLTPKISVLLL